jgi:hypothetical protein
VSTQHVDNLQRLDADATVERLGDIELLGVLARGYARTGCPLISAIEQRCRSMILKTLLWRHTRFKALSEYSKLR